MTSLPLVASARTSMKVSGESLRDLCLLWRIGEMYEGDKRMRGNHAVVRDSLAIYGGSTGSVPVISFSKAIVAYS